jgi:hypothetical protein
MDKKLPAAKTPEVTAAAASSQVNKQGKEWNNPYEWLASFNMKGIKKHWACSLVGTGFCPICHRDGDKHLPVNCPLLVELNLKLVKGPPLLLLLLRRCLETSPRPPLLLRDALWLLTKLWLLNCLPLLMFPWDWLQLSLTRSTTWGIIFVGKAMNMVLALQALLPLGVSLTTTFPFTLLAFMQLSRPLHISQFLKILHQCALRVALSSLPSVSSLRCLVLSFKLSSIIASMSAASILPGSGCCFTVADSGATDHMPLDKSAFISYKLVTNLQVRMGNNSYPPVLGQG